MMRVLRDAIPVLNSVLDFGQLVSNSQQILSDIESGVPVSRSDLLSLTSAVAGLAGTFVALVSAGPVLAVTAGVLGVASTALTFLSASTGGEEPIKKRGQIYFQ